MVVEKLHPVVPGITAAFRLVRDLRVPVPPCHRQEHRVLHRENRGCEIFLFAFAVQRVDGLVSASAFRNRTHAEPGLFYRLWQRSGGAVIAVLHAACDIDNLHASVKGQQEQVRVDIVA